MGTGRNQKGGREELDTTQLKERDWGPASETDWGEIFLNSEIEEEESRKRKTKISETKRGEVSAKGGGKYYELGLIADCRRGRGGEEKKDQRRKEVHHLSTEKR